METLQKYIFENGILLGKIAIDTKQGYINMTAFKNQPKPNPAVKEKKSLPPVCGLVLGELQGLRKRLTSIHKSVQLEAINDTFNYGQAGKELLLEYVVFDDLELPPSAYNRLWEIADEEERSMLFHFVTIESEAGIDYTKLRDFLADRKWKKASKKTTSIMLKVADEEARNCLGFSYEYKFPGINMQTIDKLWIHASAGHFGFSIQKQIYEELEGDRANDSSYDFMVEVWSQFNQRIGWMVNQRWLNYDEIIYDLAAPRGHLPRNLYRNLYNRFMVRPWFCYIDF